MSYDLIIQKWFDEDLDAPTGGTVVGSWTGTGGIVFSGTAPVSKTKEFVPSGGLVFGGVAGLAKVKVFTPSGLVLFGGAAPYAKVKAYTPSGGIIFGGNAGTMGPEIPEVAPTRMVGFLVNPGRLLRKDV